MISTLSRSENHSISSSTEEILRIDIVFHKKSIKFQVPPEIDWRKIEMDHVNPISSCDVSNDEEIKGAFN